MRPEQLRDDAGQLRDRELSRLDESSLSADLPSARTGPGGSPGEARQARARTVPVPGVTMEQARTVLTEEQGWRIEGGSLTNGRSGSTRTGVTTTDGGLVVSGDPSVVNAVESLLRTRSLASMR